MNSPSTDVGSSVELLVRTAARRRLLKLSFEQTGWLVTAFSLLGVAMLLLGADLLNPWLLAVAACAALSFLIWQMIRNRAEPGSVADEIDRSLGLQDSLSTAWFLLSSGRKDSLARSQLSYAESLSQGVEVSRVFPFRRALSWNSGLSCTILALGLLLVRYGVQYKLDWKPSILQLAMAQQTAGAAASDQQHRREASAPGSTIPGTQQQTQAQALGRELADARQGKNGTAPQDDNPGLPTESHQGKQGLFDQLRDAARSAMDKLRPASQAQASQTASDKSDTKKGDDNGQSSRQSGAQDGKQDGANKQEAAKDGSGTQSHAAGKGSEQNGSPQQGATDKGSAAQSGAGSQNGDKRFQTPEELQVQGRVKKLVGKRAPAVTGRMVVENQNPNQKLQTGYSSESGEHSNVGVEQHRNEIPPELRDALRAYMVHVHAK